MSTRTIQGQEAIPGTINVPALADFAHEVETAARSGEAAIAPVDRTAAIPLSFAQQRLWLLEQRGGTGAAYHVPMSLRLQGGLDRGALERALNQIVARHEALRTTFRAVDGEPVQHVAPVEESGVRLVEHDLLASPAADAEDELRRLVRDEASSPFDLARGPLIRGRLVRMAADDHVLLLTMHPIVSDAGSAGVLYRELGALYAAFARGEPDPLPPLPVQYADYAAWHRRRVEGEVLQRQADYWRATLAGAPELLELPTDHPRPAKQDLAGASLKVELGEALTAALKTLGQRHGATLSTTLLAGWAAVLSRLSGQDEVVVATPGANRGRSEVEGLIGCFANTLALRIGLSGAPTVAGLLDRVTSRALEARQNQDLPFEQVVELVQPARSLAHTPLFQVLFDWQDAPASRLELPGLALGPLDPSGSAGSSSPVTARFDLSLALREEGGRIEGEVTYATALFERETVERWMGYLRRVLEGMVADERGSVERLELLPDAERRRVVEAFNARRAAYPREAFVHERFEAQVERTPGAAALVFEDETLSYAELNARANRLAHGLRALGVGPDVRVGICAEPGLEMVVGVLGVLKAGGVYVPLDPGYPAERLAYMLADSAPAAVLAQAHLRDRVEGADVPVVELDAAAWAEGPETNPARGGLTAEHLAYVIYTSGSTGRPKGVRVPHRSLGATLAVAGDAFGFGAGDRVPSLASFAFDIWLFETLLPLLGGGTVRLVPRDRVPDVPRLVEDLAWCTALHAVPALMRRIVEEVRATPGGVLGTLRHAFVGGDAVAPDLLEEMRAAFPAAEIHVLYGPTEAAIICAAHRLGEEAAARQMVGRPLGNAALYVVEPGGSVAPVGVPGELCLGGASVARDYLGRPGLTAERFVPDPFSDQPGARLYRTGDRVRWLSTGELEFLGRTDHQVKVRGFRIEPGEIEARLAEHPGVREAVVLVREDTPGEKRLVAYYLADEPVAVDALKSHLAERLPEYMVPAAYVWMETYPLTPNGKLDRRALPAPGGDAYAARAYEAPVGETEQAVAAIWAEVLGAERVGGRDHFFDLGGHSLLATQVVSRIRELFGVELPLSALFEGPTVAELARRVEEARQAELPVVPPLVPAERTGALPLSFAQERLWFLHQMEPEDTGYNGPWPSRLRGHLDASALERALGELVRRHESLRTTFHPAEQGAVQVVHPAAPAHLPVVDLTGLAPRDREDEARRLAQEDAERPFDLERGPLLRVALLRLSGEEHVLLLTIHHIVSDGWSMDVLFRELFTLYEWFSGLSGAPGPASPPLAVQHAGFAVGQRGRLQDKVLDRQLSYWRERLAGVPELLELPTDHPRPPVQTSGWATVPVELSPELLVRLQALGRGERATLYMTLLGAFQVLLSKYSGSEDIVVGSPAAGRKGQAGEELVGFLVNTLVLRTDLGGNPGFREVLRRAREVTLGAYGHQDVPFETLVAELQPERSSSHSPLFQAMFTLRDAGDDGGALPGLEVSGVDAGLASARFDLSLSLTATAEGLRGGLGYSTDLFERGTVERMLGHLERVLEQVAADADVRLSELDLLSAEERVLVVDAWNRTEAGYPADRCIHELFEVQAARTPDAVAATGGTAALTYAGLNARANRLARHLVRLGVGPEARVGVCLERGPELMVCTLAVLKAGGAYVAMDPAYPPARLALMLRDSGAAVLLTDGRGAAPAEQDGVHVVRVDRDADAFAAESAADLLNRVSPRNAAYVVYTSGTTGTPKGVVVEHASLGALCAWHVRAFGVREADRATQVAGPGFDAAVWEVWPYLTSGASVHVAPEEVRADPPALRDWLVEQAITVSFIPTPVAEPLLTLEWPADAALRWLLAGGDRLRARPRAGMPFALSNNYGPTECTVVATSGVVEAGGTRTPSIGRPIENTRVHVLDAGLRPLPVGVPGELCIGGAQVARGYLDRPALTAERFVPDPFSAQGGARLYRSGDRVRWLADGTIEYLGRLDEQVKVRGFRIELGEIEAGLRQAPGVADCAVVARENAAGDRRLVAYIVGEAEAEALREHLRRSLPEYMVPSAFVPLEALPLTPNGKVDRKALPVPEGDAYAAREHEAPVGETEQAMAVVWAEVLGAERVGRHDNFLDLGGHSLLGTRVVSRIREVFGVEVPLRALFEGPTVAELAQRVEEVRRAGLPVVPPMVLVERTGALPLSFAQERLWFLHQMEPEDAGYNVPWPSRLRGSLDVWALERALGELMRRHEVLRTTFRPVEQGAVQVFHPAAPAQLPVLDLTGLTPQDHEREARRLVREDAERPFDLERGPLLRATLVRLSGEEHVLLLTLHHIVSDGWSMGVLFRDLLTLYQSLSQSPGAASPLPPLAVQYADFAVWQREWLQGEVLRRQVEWWRERLGGAPPALELPTDRPRPAVASSRGAAHVFRVPAEVARGLRSLARREGATLYMVTHAAFDLLLSRWSGQEDLVVGSPIAGRTEMGTEGLIGFFVNTLALRIDLSGDPSFQELMGCVRETALGAYAYQDLPFERLVEEVAPDRGLSHTPLFQVMFALQNAGYGDGPAVAGLRLEPFGSEVRTFGSDSRTVRFDLELDLTEVGEELVGTLRFRTDLFDGATMERFAAQYGVVLAGAVASPEERLSRLAILPPEEARTLLAYGNGPAREDTGVPVHRLFAAQAARTPDATAVLFGTEPLTYAEVNARAERLARRLRGRGVARGTTVAVCLARGPGSVVAPLAVWKAGGVYLPLDPAHPAERLSFLLGDSGAGLVVTEPALAGRMAERNVELVLLDAEDGEGAEEDGAAAEVQPGDLAYLIYTSGSTGTPKAVMVEHAQLTHTLGASLETLGFAPGDVVAALASTSFDISLLELLTPLLTGGAVRVVSQALVRDPEELAGAVADVTVLHAVPALMRQVVEAVRGGRMLPSLRLLLVGGDSVPPDLLEDMREVFPDAQTVVLYGPTEAAIICATYAVPAEGAVVGHPLGRPLPGVRLAVRGPRGELAPVGVPGEVWISGGGVARGYLGRPELNAEKFVSIEGERAYRTGDRARWRPDGVLEFLGRADEQVKVRGFRRGGGRAARAARRPRGRGAGAGGRARRPAPGRLRGPRHGRRGGRRRQGAGVGVGNALR
jgi:amino acid adenylation domain-containing protein